MMKRCILLEERGIGKFPPTPVLLGKGDADLGIFL